MDQQCLNSLTLWENPLFANILLVIILVLLSIYMAVDFWSEAKQNYKEIGVSEVRLKSDLFNVSDESDTENMTNVKPKYKNYVTHTKKHPVHVRRHDVSKMNRQLKRIQHTLTDWDDYEIV